MCITQALLGMSDSPVGHEVNVNESKMYTN